MFVDPSSSDTFAGVVLLPWIMVQGAGTFLMASVYGILEGWLAVRGSTDWWPFPPPRCQKRKASPSSNRAAPPARRHRPASSRRHRCVHRVTRPSNPGSSSGEHVRQVLGRGPRNSRRRCPGHLVAHRSPASEILICPDEHLGDERCPHFFDGGAIDLCVEGGNGGCGFVGVDGHGCPGAQACSGARSFGLCSGHGHGAQP